MGALAAPDAAVAARGRRRRFDVPVVIAVALAILALVLVLAAIGPLLAPQDPAESDLLIGVSGPSAEHLLGTNELGQDILSRVMAGARTAVSGPATVAACSMLIGSLLGLLAGYRGGWIDATIMRVADLLYSLPGLLVTIVVIGVVGGGYWLAVALLVVLGCPYDTRVIRGATLEQRKLAYVEAARTLGVRDTTVMYRHIWPNLLPIILANTLLTFAFALVALSSLSFLGFGVAPGAADWGRMLSDGRELVFDNPAAALAPGIALVLTAASVNVVGDWIGERYADRGAR
jgi:peptide/nickel transport system permease protein